MASTQYPKKISVGSLLKLRADYEEKNIRKISEEKLDEEKRLANIRLLGNQQCEIMKNKYANNINKFITLINSQLVKQAELGEKCLTLETNTNALGVDNVPREDLTFYNLALVRSCKEYFNEYRVETVIADPSGCYCIKMTWG
jgi:hypothetical protein